MGLCLKIKKKKKKETMNIKQRELEVLTPGGNQYFLDTPETWDSGLEYRSPDTGMAEE